MQPSYSQPKLSDAVQVKPARRKANRIESAANYARPSIGARSCFRLGFVRRSITADCAIYTRSGTPPSCYCNRRARTSSCCVQLSASAHCCCTLTALLDRSLVTKIACFTKAVAFTNINALHYCSVCGLHRKSAGFLMNF